MSSTDISVSFVHQILLNGLILPIPNHLLVLVAKQNGQQSTSITQECLLMLKIIKRKCRYLWNTIYILNTSFFCISVLVLNRKVSSHILYVNGWKKKFMLKTRVKKPGWAHCYSNLLWQYSRQIRMNRLSVSVCLWTC